MIRDFFKWTYLFFLDNLITNRSLIAIEIYAYFKQALAVNLGLRNKSFTGGNQVIYEC